MKIKTPCSVCGKSVPQIDKSMCVNIKNYVEMRYTIRCEHCGSETGGYRTLREAAAAWNDGRFV